LKARDFYGNSNFPPKMKIKIAISTNFLSYDKILAILIFIFGGKFKFPQKPRAFKKSRITIAGNWWKLRGRWGFKFKIS
jgi:hypothetical protein